MEVNDLVNYIGWITIAIITFHVIKSLIIIIRYL